MSEVTAEGAGFPEQVWLGIKRGEWPVEAFNDEEMAKRWSAQGGNGMTSERIRYVVGPIDVDPDLPARRAVKVPETTAWEEL